MGDSTHQPNLKQDKENTLTDIQEFASWLGDLTTRQRRLFWIIHYLAMKYKSVYVSQATLAKQVPYSVRQVIRNLKVFVEKGYLFSTNRGCKTNLYELPDFLMCKNLEKQIRTAFVTPNVTLNVTQCYHDKYINTRNLTNTRKTNCHTDEEIQPKENPKIKRVFLNTSFTEKDQIAFSRYEDIHINQAIKAYEAQKKRLGADGIKNKAAFFNKLLWKAKNGILNDLDEAHGSKSNSQSKQFKLDSFSDLNYLGEKYSVFSMCHLVAAFESYNWYKNKVGDHQIRDKEGLFYSIAKEKKFGGHHQS